jgi:hypothetical protein
VSLQVAGDVEVMTCQYVAARARPAAVVGPAGAAAAATDGGERSAAIARQRWSWIAVVPLVAMAVAVGVVGLRCTVGRVVRPVGLTVGVCQDVVGRRRAAGCRLDDDGVADPTAGSATSRTATHAPGGDPGAPAGCSGRRAARTYTDPILDDHAARRARAAGAPRRCRRLARASGARAGRCRWAKVEIICAATPPIRRWRRPPTSGGGSSTVPARARPRAAALRPRHDGHDVDRLRAVGAEVAPDTCVSIDNRAWQRLVGLLSLDVFASLPTLPGMDLRRLARRPGGPIVAIGNKQPGTAVPMLARLDGDRAAWTVEVPAAEPLTSRADDRAVTLSDRAVFAVYEAGSVSRARLAAFALADGHRLWDVALTPDGAAHVGGMIATGELVVVATPASLAAFDQADGHLRFQIGAR